MTLIATSQRADLTFKHNLKHGRHGWLRLTPAYSVRVVHDIVERHPSALSVLDPFSGTGTTGLVCAEQDVDCDLLELNPFLVWLAEVKTGAYSAADLELVRKSLAPIGEKVRLPSATPPWTPPIANIDRWWNPVRLTAIARLFDGIQTHVSESPAKNLLLLAFCRTMIEWSNAAFNHQSMSFKAPEVSLFDETQEEEIFADFCSRALRIVDAAAIPIGATARVRQADSRRIPDPTRQRYDLVITSPPYPNRMSYVRELRPYMYWLGYLKEAREAGDLDWEAIGGTWGVATSRVQKWKSDGTVIPFENFNDLLDEVARSSTLLANYIHRYFVDMTQHFLSLRPRVQDGAEIYYVVGNSKFFDTVIPVEKIFAAMMESSGFGNISIDPLRKRNSKKELVEFVVSARA